MSFSFDLVLVFHLVLVLASDVSIRCRLDDYDDYDDYDDDDKYELYCLKMATSLCKHGRNNVVHCVP